MAMSELKTNRKAHNLQKTKSHNPSKGGTTHKGAMVTPPVSKHTGGGGGGKRG